MSPDAEIAALRADAVEAMAAFGAWWERERALMHRVTAAAPRARPWQGPPYVMHPGRRLRMSLDARLAWVRARHRVTAPVWKAARAKTAAQLRYLTRKAERKTRSATITSMSTGSLGIEDSRRFAQGALTNFREAPPMRGPTLTPGPDLPPSAPERA